MPDGRETEVLHPGPAASNIRAISSSVRVAWPEELSNLLAFVDRDLADAGGG